MKKLLLIIACFGCLNVNAQRTKPPAGNAETVKFEKKLAAKYGKQAFHKAEEGKVWIGMADELCEFSLGYPNSVKKNHTQSGTSEIWIYQGVAPGCIGGGCPYLDYVITFKNHVAVSITEGD